MTDEIFIFREASLADEDAILELARELDTLNLPPERNFIRGLLERSVESFAGGSDPDLFDPTRRFLFVLEGGDGRVVGTSMIHAQHGTPSEPHVFFRVDTQERYAKIRLDNAEERQVHMVHTILTLGQTYQGPSEVGGLVLSPALRGHPNKLGRLLSLARFVFMAGRRAWFRDRVLAELLPPLQFLEDGTRSPLWDALGGRFTGLTYDEADALSRDDKEFIWKLFPLTPVNASLLPRNVQDILGQVGPDSQGARRLLESIGFSYSGRIDPFDGGPHFEVATDDITLIRDARGYRPEVGVPGADALPGVVGAFYDTAPHFRAVWAPVSAVALEGASSGSVTGEGARAQRGRASDLAGDDDGDSGELGSLTVAESYLRALDLLDGQGQVRPDARLVVGLRPMRRRADLQIARAASGMSRKT